MIGEDLEQRVMALPLADRVALAEVLWESIDPAVGAPPASEEKEAVAEACCETVGWRREPQRRAVTRRS